MQRASLLQVRAGRGGRMITIEDDVMDICRRIQEIDSSLGVDWSETGNYFRVYQLLQGGRKHTVITAVQLTPELVEEIRRTVHPSYDLAAELERSEAQAERDRKHQFAEQAGETGERLFHALRKDLQVQDRIYVPRGVDRAT